MTGKISWDDIWKTEGVRSWDSLSESIYRALRESTGPVEGLAVLEAGSGSGRISLRLATEGAQAHLLDISAEALRRSREHAARLGVEATFVEASVLAMPFPDDCFDVVWSAGLLEHFSREEQRKALNEMRRVCKKNGRIVVFVPFAGAVFYDVGRRFAQAAGIWPYGEEVRMFSPRPLFASAGITPLQETTIAFEESLSFLGFLPAGEPVARLVRLWHDGLPEEQRRGLGGYLLMTTGRPTEESTSAPRAPAITPSSDSRTDVVCLAPIPWDYLWQRVNHFMWRLAERGHRLIFVSPVARHLSAEDAGTFQKNGKAMLAQWVLQNMQRVGDRIHVVDFVSAAVSTRGELLANVGAEFFAVLRSLLQIANPIVWVYLPQWHEYIDALGPTSCVVYDCVDDHRGFSSSPESVILAEEALLARADVVLVTSRPLLQAKTSLKDEVYLVPNGVDFAHFSSPRTCPGDLASLPRPRIGFSGAIASWVDQELLAYLAASHPEWSIVLIGPAFTGTQTLDRLPNAYLLGKKPYAELPAYVQHLDIGVVPFRINVLTQHANPIKIYEYLACGLPVVSTDIPEARSFPGLVEVAATPREFREAVERLLQTPADNRQSRLEVARRNTWDNRLEVALHLVQAYAALNAADPAGAAGELAAAAKLTGDPRIMRASGEAYCHAGMFTEARTCFARALASLPAAASREELVVMFHAAGIKLYEKKQLPQAEAVFTYALSLAPEDIDSHVNLGHVCAAQARYREALAWFVRALELDPSQKDVWQLAAQTLALLGEDKLAVRCQEQPATPARAAAGELLCRLKKLSGETSPGE